MTLNWEDRRLPGADRARADVDTQLEHLAEVTPADRGKKTVLDEDAFWSVVAAPLLDDVSPVDYEHVLNRLTQIWSSRATSSSRFV